MPIRLFLTIAVLLMAVSPLVFADPAPTMQSTPIRGKALKKKNRPIVYGRRYTRNIMRGVTRKDIFKFNTLFTTPFGPAYADIWTAPSNFIQCQPPQGGTFSYALCYYSGPEQPTGLSEGNPALPCTMSKNGVVANCTCYEISTAVVSPSIPYFVALTSILNTEVYLRTIDVCGLDGSKCAGGAREAPVCGAINSNTLIPGADLTSVFSPVKKLDYPAGSTVCEADLYAGCMTAPCYRTGEIDEHGNPLVECKCPVFNGRFEIGQASTDQNPLSCDAGSNQVWSAAHNPLTNNPIDPPPPPGRCTPDAPPDKGCPLFDAATDYNISPDGPLCQKVCTAYQNGTREQFGELVQVGYTCDSTLCTTLGLGQDLPLPASVTGAVRTGLMGAACKGIQDIAGMNAIIQLEELAQCSCCASQVCGCAGDDAINAATQREISLLNQAQEAVGIVPQCQLNGTLCGEK